MLLSKDAIAEVLELLREDDFYRPAHRTVFRSVLELYGHGDAVDAVTVQEELRRNGALADIGGAPFLHTLVASVPTAANASYYARIVKEAGVLRRLIDVGTQIVQLGFETPQDTERAVDIAESLVYQVAQGRVTEDYHSLRDVLTGTLEAIERLHEDHREITGVPTGFPDLDRLTSGLQPSNLIMPALLLSARGTADSVLYHVQRGVQIESLWANLIGIAHLFGLPAQTVYGFGAYDLTSSVSGVFKALSGVATAAGLAAAAWLVWRRARARGGLGPADWAGAFTLGTFAFVLPTRVLSPQYLVWLCAPMVGLALVLAGRRALWTLVAAALVSQVVFPFRYTQLRRLYPLDIGLLTLRNLLLLVACALVVQAFNRQPDAREGAVETRR